MDSLVHAGTAGFQTRGEFIVDAIQERLLELTLDEMEPPTQLSVSHAMQAPENAVHSAPPHGTSSSTAMTEIPSIATGITVPISDEIGYPLGKPLFGLHNRDYPSIWTLSRLAELASDSPIPVVEFVRQVVEEAWRFGGVLTDLERISGMKTTAIFPTNTEKRKSSEARFISFAIGEFRRESERHLAATGPLFEWQVASLSGLAADPMIAVTEAGWALLHGMEGLSVEEPHPMEYGLAFLEHVRVASPADYRGFANILLGVGSRGATRAEVLARTSKAEPQWTSNEVSTNAAGFIARAREWGLLERKQTHGQYQLTRFGEGHTAQLTGEVT